MAQEGDIVFLIGGDVTGLTRAGQAGEKSLAEMERAAKTLQRQIGKIGEAGVQFQREMNKLTGVTTEFSKSARDSAAAFEAFDKARAQVDSLRASIDPLFAASKRYEAALQQLDSALEMGAISAREHAAMMDQLSAAYLSADAAADVMTGNVGFLGRMSSETQGKLQQMGFQIQDFAVQVGAGTSATQAFAQQFPQLAGAFGPAGVAIGTLAAVSIPLLSAAFASLGSAARTFDDAMGDVEGSISRLNELGKAYASDGLSQLQAKYGEVNAELLLFVQRMREAEQARAIEAMREAISGIADEMGAAFDAINGPAEDLDLIAQMLQEDFGLTVEQVRQLRTAMEQVSKAETFEQQAAAIRQVRELLAQSGIKGGELYQKVLQAEDAMRQLAAAAPQAGWLGAAIDQAQSLGQKLWDAVKAKAAFEIAAAGPGMTTGSSAWSQNGVGFTLPGSELLPPQAAGSAGGGGGGVNQLQTQLDALRQQMMTEEQIEMQSYAKRQEMLQQALDQRLMTQEEYAALMQGVNEQHQSKMAEIDVMRYGSVLDQANAFMGGMATILQQGGQEQQRIAAIFGAAQALISTYQGAAKELEKGTFGFASAAAVIAKGMGFVGAIRSAGKSGRSGGGSTGSTSSATSSASSPLDVRLTGIGANDFFSGAQISSLLDRLSSEAGDRGYRLMVAQ